MSGPAAAQIECSAFIPQFVQAVAGTVTVPNGASSMWILALGGTGGPSTNLTAADVIGGGGSGAASTKIAVKGGNTFTVTLGAGGAGSSSGSQNGGAGGATTATGTVLGGTFTVTGNGGSGGTNTGGGGVTGTGSATGGTAPVAYTGTNAVAGGSGSGHSGFCSTSIPTIFLNNFLIYDSGLASVSSAAISANGVGQGAPGYQAASGSSGVGASGQVYIVYS
jgi:hypothetical protein